MAVQQGYKDLLVWQRGMKLAKQVHVLTRSFPAEERYGLTAQVRGACYSVHSNIAEGYGRENRPESRQFLRYARGSLFEVETQMPLGRDFGFVDGASTEAISREVQEISKMLHSLLKKLA